MSVDTKPQDDMPPEVFRFGVSLLFLVTASRLLVNSNEFYPLHGDEAQYWLWAQELSFGYYSKPPLIAWIIGAFTGLLGDREFVVRLASPLLHLGTALLIYGIGNRLFSRRVGFWGSLTYILIPGVSWSSLLISTDPPLLFCWALSLYALVRAVEAPQKLKWWLVGGVAFGVGLLAKYAMVYFLAGLLLWVVAKRRDLLRMPGLWLMIAVGLAVLSPNLIWNAMNGGATLAHTADNADLGHGVRLDPAKLGDFIAGQLGVFGPITFAALVGLIVVRFKTLWKAEATALLLCLILPSLVLMTGLSMLSRANANWAAVSYVGGSVLVAAMLAEGKRGRMVLIAATVLHVVAMGIGYTYHDLARMAGVEIPYKSDPTRRFQGGRTIGRAVAGVLAERGMPVLMTDQRLLYAQLAYYARPRKQVQWDANGRTDSQFEMENPASQAREDTILYVTRSNQPGALQHFREQERIGAITVPLGKGASETYHLFLLRGLTDPPSKG
ncbi:ArnT family glycosyltransferase [Lacibacterium aquatile]|uniref:ArnT family glycosyltransferase n=1 Tax=Lacibacterium aquatile TaxID=1168082 RepID=A0ABW5DWH4_9PROT